MNKGDENTDEKAENCDDLSDWKKAARELNSE